MAVFNGVAHMVAGLWHAAVAPYLPVHDAANASLLVLPPAAITLANSVWGGVHEVGRAEFSVDTSPLGAGATITAGSIDIWLARPAHGSETDPGQTVIHIVEGIHGAVPALADYGLLLPQVISGGVGPAYAAVLVAPGSYHNIPLNANGLSWVNPIGDTRFGLRLFGDINALPPTGFNDIEIYTAHAIELNITYTPLSNPTVQTDPATNIEAKTATLNGTLIDDGGEACACGFDWGEAIGSLVNATPTQNRTTGQVFSQALSGLQSGKIYFFRAKATNSA